MLIFMEAKTTLARRQDAVQGDFMRKMLTNAGCLLCGILVSRERFSEALHRLGRHCGGSSEKVSFVITLRHGIRLCPAQTLGQLSLPCRCGGNRRSAVAAR